MAKPQKRKYSIKFLQLSTPRQTWRYLQTSVPESGQSWKLNWKKWRIITTKVVIATKNGSTTQTWLIALEWMLLLSQPSLWNPQQFNAEGDESDSSADGHDEDSAGTSKKKTPKKRPARKRRSRSSASEMLSFLKEYQEKKEVEWKTKKLR